MSNQEKKQSFYGGAAMLVASAAIVKVLGGIFKIPLARIIPDEAYGDFNAAYNIYTFFLTICTAGFPVALSKSVAEAHALGRENQVQKIFRAALTFFIGFGILSFIVMFFFSEFCATVILNTERVTAQWAVQGLAVSVLCVCIMSAFRGFAQGLQDMKPTSISQVIESSIKVAIGLGLVFYIGSAFADDFFVGEMQSTGATIGVSAGSAVALVYLIFNFLKTRKRDRLSATDQPDSYGKIITYLLAIAVPITLGSAANTLVTLIDTNQVNGILSQQFWPEAEALFAAGAYPDLSSVAEVASTLAAKPYGIYGKTMSLYNLPAFFIVPFTASILPAVSAALAKKEYKNAQVVSESALKIGFLVACPMGVGLCTLGGPICKLVLNLDANVAGPLLSTLGIAAIFICIANLCQSVLNASGKMWYPIISVVIGGVVKIFVNRYLVAIPEIGIYGAPVGTLCCFVIISALDLIFIKRFVPTPPRYMTIFPKIIIASVVMGAGAWGVQGLLMPLLGNSIATLGAILVAVAIYVILVLIFKVFSIQDVQLMPKGDKIAKILRIK